LQIAAASEPGSPAGPNEDGVVTTTNMVAVLDGATVRTATGCIHGVPWYVENLAGSLVKHSELAPAEALVEAISETATAHRDTCDLHHPGTPSAALAIVQVYRDSIRYLVLGDVTLVIETTDGLRIVTDNRVSATASAERAVADALPSGSPEKAVALVHMKRAELAARNVPGGYWISAADPGVVSHALIGDIPLRTVQRAAVLTDGAARAVMPFKLYNWPDLLSAMTVSGPSQIIKQVRDAEAADPAGIQQPRNKIHDDATIAVITLLPARIPRLRPRATM
jgi:hypothetical protein